MGYSLNYKIDRVKHKGGIYEKNKIGVDKKGVGHSGQNKWFMWVERQSSLFKVRPSKPGGGGGRGAPIYARAGLGNQGLGVEIGSQSLK